MKKPMLIVPILCLTALGAGARGELAAAAERTASDAPKVEVVPVETRHLVTQQILPAQLLPFESVDLYPKVTGFIEQIQVDRGSQVTKGELLARLSAPELMAKSKQAAATAAAAKAKLASDRATYERTAAAARTPGAVAENALDVARQLLAADRDQADADAQAARAAQILTSYLAIRAPFDGVITKRYLHPGALVGPSTQTGQPILHLVMNHLLRLTVAVPENAVQAAKVGQPFTFTVPYLPGETFRTKIARMADAVDPHTYTMAIEADIRNTGDRLIPGSFVSVQWPVQRAQASLWVPATAVTNNQERNFVIQVEHGRAHWVDVRVGRSVAGSTEVFAAQLHPGDLIIRRATDTIRNGASVQVVTGK
jgi:RND family efflux transporter, MFP subunit